jgi:hypothetical protein
MLFVGEVLPRVFYKAVEGNARTFNRFLFGKISGFAD